MITEQEFKQKTKRLAFRGDYVGGRATARNDFSGSGQAVAALRYVRWCELSSVVSEQVTRRHDGALAIVEEEGDEEIYRLDLLVEAGIIGEERIVGLRSELEEVVTMTVASLKMLRNRSRSTPA